MIPGGIEPANSPLTSSAGGGLRAQVLSVHGLSKRYGSTPIFEGVDLDVAAGEFVAVVGESGVGKSTFLNILAGLDNPDAGTVLLNSKPITRLDATAQAMRRRAELGFVFQAFHVLPHLNVAHNVGLPLMLLGRPDAKSVSEMLAEVGLSGFEARMPQTLSGGQLQRVAIARALIHSPSLILADEPTGNLDPATAEQVIELLCRQVRDRGAACVLVTHAHAAAARADRTVRLTAHGMQAQ